MLHDEAAAMLQQHQQQTNKKGTNMDGNIFHKNVGSHFQRNTTVVLKPFSILYVCVAFPVNFE